jgi:glutamyl-tRNA reductase
VNHRTAPVEVRERVMLLQDDLPRALALLKRAELEGAILSTCNRTEVYAVTSTPEEGIRAAVSCLAEANGLAPAEIEPYVYRLSQKGAVSHLFAVASGIDSLVLGETEILGQVRSALIAASEAGTVGVPLSRLFHAALRTGRMAREQTGISRHAASVSSAGVQLARQVFGGLEQCRVLVISAGEAGALTARCLKDAGAATISVANRTRSKAEELAEELGGRALEFAGIPSALAEHDVVISATASSRFVLHRDAVAAAMDRRAGRPLCLIDIAVPRDIDPDSRSVKNVHLFDIDDLEAVSLLGMQERRNAVADVERIVEAEAERFLQWLSTTEAMPVVRDLIEKAEALRRRELEKSLAKLGHLSPEDRDRIDMLTKALVRKLLHDPIAEIKAEGPRAGALDAARKLFRLERERPCD